MTTLMACDALSGRFRRVALALLCCFPAVSFPGCDSGSSPTAPPAGTAPAGDFEKVENTLRFSGVRSVLRQPGQVQFLFALRDQRDWAVLLQPEALESRTRIFEDDEEIDYSETNFFAATAENLRMDVVLVLDFTRSMATASSGDTTAIERMLLGAKQIIRSLGAAHRVAMVEFHDRNVEPAVLSYFTSDTTLLNATLDAFASRTIDHGATRVWDAVQTGLSLFPEGGDGDDVRLLIFLSDGNDTSSRTTPAQLIAAAQARKVQVHSVGTGDVRNLAVLRQLTSATDGLYYDAGETRQIDTQLAALARSLTGQYKLSYISLRRGADPVVRVEVEYEQQLNSFARRLALSEVEADDRIGRLTYDDDVIADDRATAFLRIEHTPRNTRVFRFQLQSSLIAGAEIVRKGAGGLLDENWDLDGPVDGWITIRSTADPLPFGAFGLLAEIRFAPISGSGLAVPFVVDNSLYSGGKSFQFPDTLFLGLPIDAVTPAPDARDVVLQPEFSWIVGQSRATESPEFSLHLDTVPTADAIVATGLSGSPFQLPQQLTSQTTYYWKIAARAGRNQYTSPVWKFTTGDP